MKTGRTILITGHLLCLSCCLILIFGKAAYAARKDYTKLGAGQLFAMLRQLPQERGSWGYYDMHGNASEELRQLMRMRFGATKDILRELETVSHDKLPVYAAALYRSLGFVKDPATIDWLKKIRDGPHADFFYSAWMQEWETQLWGPGHRDIKWLEGEAQWSAFFQDCVRHATDSKRRVDLLRAMRGWFHDPGTLAFFTELERSPKTEGEELLLAQLYLRQHLKPINEARLESTIRKFKKSVKGTQLLLLYAQALRHEAFIPWLISIAGPKTEDPEVGSTQWVLQTITFRLDVSGTGEWKAWYAKHGKETRKRWVDQASAEFNLLLKSDPARAGQFLERAVYSWNDIILLPHMKTLIKCKALHNHLAGWINLTYSPPFRNLLKPMADAIIKQSGNDLKDWAKNLLKGLEYFPGKRAPWDDQFNYYRL